MNEVVKLIEHEQPDVFAYAEVCIGSFRNQYFNQHEYIKSQITRLSLSDSAVSKYGDSILNSTPYHKGNANGVLSFQPATISEFYLTKSKKKLFFKVELSDVTIFTVHLPLISTDRIAQLHELASIVNNTSGNVIVCGDFNILNGIDELSIFTDSTGMVAAESLPTYPSAYPLSRLDVFMHRLKDRNTTPSARVIPMTASDHLPIIFEW